MMNSDIRLRTFSYVDLVNVLKKWGFKQDIETFELVVMRNSNFPFQRIVIPRSPKICIELIQTYARDLKIPPSNLFRWLL